MGDGAGNFTSAPNVAVGSSTVTVAIGDFNGDGKQDFAASGGSNIVSVRLGACLPLTAASVSIGGRITDGRNGVANAIVYLTDAQGNTQMTRTTSFGYYRFDDIEAGQTVVLQVSARRYSFAPQLVAVNEVLTNVNFTAQ